MAAAKSSVRSRNVASQPGVPQANGHSNYDAYPGEQLTAFETENFDAKGYVETKCQSMSEKGIRKLCDELMDLKKASAEEMRKSVYANYSAFIRTSREISDLEGEIMAMRNLLNSQAALIRTLAESGASMPLGPTGGDSCDRDYYSKNDPESTEAEQRAQDLPDILDILLAERKVVEALGILDEGDSIVSKFLDEKGNGAGVSEVAVLPLQDALTERRARLAQYLAEAVRQPYVRGTELRSAISALDRLGDGCRAHTLLLQSHEERLKNNMRGLRPSGTSYGGSYTTPLSQLVFSAIAQASRDSVAVFGEDPSFASELVLWAENVTNMYASIVKRHALSSLAASGGLRAAAECVQIALGHCSLLEEQGLTLCPMLLKLLRPSVEQALRANLTMIGDSVAALAAADEWVLDHPPQRGSAGMRLPQGLPGIVTSSLKLSSSAHRFNFMVQDFLEDVAPLVSMQLGGPTLDGIADIFDQYIGMLIMAVPNTGFDEEDTRKGRIAATEAQQLALLGNAAALAEELLPRAANKLVPEAIVGDSQAKGGRGQTGTLSGRTQELREWKRRLQKGVENLRLSIGNAMVVDLCYDDGDEGSKLNAITYLSIDHEMPMWHTNPMPTPIFQSLFIKLTSIQQTAMDVLAGRDRVVQLLLIRLTETFVIGLANDQDFWSDIEKDTLGPKALQQFILDMEFLTLVAKNGGFLSRTVRQVIADQQEKMEQAYAATGADLSSALPEAEWLQSTAAGNLRRLLENWNRHTGGVPYEITSPTASISAQSVSSMRSE